MDHVNKSNVDWDHSGGQCISDLLRGPSVHPFNLLSTCFGLEYSSTVRDTAGKEPRRKRPALVGVSPPHGAPGHSLPTLG